MGLLSETFRNGVDEMLQEAYDKKRISGIGVGVGMVTFLSSASMSSELYANSQTVGINSAYVYEGISFVNDKEGDMCISSLSSNMLRGDIVDNTEKLAFKQKRERKAVEIQVTHVSKHISRFDFEDEYEEM